MALHAPVTLRHAAMYSYHVNATFLRLIPHSTTITTLDMNRTSGSQDGAHRALSRTLRVRC